MEEKRRQGTAFKTYYLASTLKTTLPVPSLIKARDIKNAQKEQSTVLKQQRRKGRTLSFTCVVQFVLLEVQPKTKHGAEIGVLQAQWPY